MTLIALHQVGRDLILTVDNREVAVLLLMLCLFRVVWGIAGMSLSSSTRGCRVKYGEREYEAPSYEEMVKLIRIRDALIMPGGSIDVPTTNGSECGFLAVSKACCSSDHSNARSGYERLFDCEPPIRQMMESGLTHDDCWKKVSMAIASGTPIAWAAIRRVSPD